MQRAHGDHWRSPKHREAYLDLLLDSICKVIPRVLCIHNQVHFIRHHDQCSSLTNNCICNSKFLSLNIPSLRIKNEDGNIRQLHRPHCVKYGKIFNFITTLTLHTSSYTSCIHNLNRLLLPKPCHRYRITSETWCFSCDAAFLSQESIYERRLANVLSTQYCKLQRLYLIAHVLHCFIFTFFRQAQSQSFLTSQLVNDYCNIRHSLPMLCRNWDRLSKSSTGYFSKVVEYSIIIHGCPSISLKLICKNGNFTVMI